MKKKSGGMEHWFRRLPEAGENTGVRSCESLMRDIAELDERRAALLAELREENDGVLERAAGNWTAEEIAAAVEGWSAPKFWAEAMEAE